MDKAVKDKLLASKIMVARELISESTYKEQANLILHKPDSSEVWTPLHKDARGREGLRQDAKRMAVEKGETPLDAMTESVKEQLVEGELSPHQLVIAHFLLFKNPGGDLEDRVHAYCHWLFDVASSDQLSHYNWSVADGWDDETAQAKSEQIDELPVTLFPSTFQEKNERLLDILKSHSEPSSTDLGGLMKAEKPLTKWERGQEGGKQKRPPTHGTYSRSENGTPIRNRDGHDERPQRGGQRGGSSMGRARGGGRGGVTPCRYFSTPTGCKNGDNCSFSHAK